MPREFGGYEIDPHEFIDVGLEVAQACCSTGWLTTFYMEHNWVVAASLSIEAVDEIFSAQPYVLAPGAVNPMGGVATPVDGGFELSGRWHFNSGIVHGDWVILTALDMADEAPKLRVYLVPREGVRVEDTWDVGGMRGTGSHDAVVDKVFVPERFASPVPPPKRRSTTHDHYDMCRLPALGLLQTRGGDPDGRGGQACAGHLPGAALDPCPADERHGSTGQGVSAATARQRGHAGREGRADPASGRGSITGSS